MITAAWQLGGGTGPQASRLCKWAHMLGYGGHFLTKSRRYSVTFGQLRQARTDHRKQQNHPDGQRDPWGRPLDETVVLVLSTWTYDGPGHTIAPAAELALAPPSSPATTIGRSEPLDQWKPEGGQIDRTCRP